MKKLLSIFIILHLFFNSLCFASTYWPAEVYTMDKYENFNRKVFNVNLKLNRLIVKKVHIVWASIFPNFVIDSLTRFYNNIQYPKKLISCTLQRDFHALSHETKRFFINTTLGIGGLIDSAYKIFKLEPYDEDMEQALSKCKMKQGTYFVLPFVSSITFRDALGRLFDFALNPSTYVSSPVAAVVKFGLLINRTTKIQPLIKMVESNFADPYDIAKKAYILTKDVRDKNYDRDSIVSKIQFVEDELVLVDKKEDLQVRGRIKNQKISSRKYKVNLDPDIFLDDYNSISPLSDSMRTILFDIKNEHKSIWPEISIWNRNFDKKIKTAYVEIVKDKPKYKFRYILQKNKTSPLAIIFPSIGSGVESAHNTNFAKIFYEQGYSVIILGSHFQWEFIRSVGTDYYPGNIKNDIDYINSLVNNSINYVSKKHNKMFTNKVALGTSLGAYGVLFLANKQMEDNSNFIDKFIAVSPPIELDYSMGQIDKIMNIANLQQNPDTVEIIGAKLYKAYKNRKDYLSGEAKFPLSIYETNILNAYIFHQRLSDIIYFIETSKSPKIDRKELYKQIDETNFKGYTKKYLNAQYSPKQLKNVNNLKAISNYLISNDNYVIFHALDDYLVNKAQLRELKSYSMDKMILINNGSHLGYLYRDEFIEALKEQIKLK